MHNLTGFSDRYGNMDFNDSKMQRLFNKLNYPIEDILRAVQEVGYDSEEVEEYIRDRYNRC